MKRWPIFILAALTSAALIVAIVLFRENSALRDQMAALQKAQTASATVREATPPPAPPPDAATQPSEATAAASPPVAVAVDATQPERPNNRRASDPRERGAELVARALTDPESRAAMLSHMKGQIDRTFGAYFMKLGLNETQIEALRSVMAERQLARVEGGILERNADTDQARADAKTWRDAQLASTEADINGILGPDGLKGLQDYLTSAPQRRAVDDIARRATYAGAPLSSGDNDRLLQVVRQAATDLPLPQLPGRGGGWGADGDGASGGGRRDRQPVTAETVSTYMTNLRAQNQQIIEQSKTFLTQPQLEALADQQIDAIQQTEAQLNFMLRNPDVRGAIGGFGDGNGGGGGGRGPRGGG